MNCKNIITICLTFCVLQLFSQTETELKPTIKSATVFRNGAFILSEVKTVLKPGLNRISIIGNPEKIDAKSIQLNGIGNFTILSVKPGISYIQRVNETTIKREKTLAKKDSITYQLKVLNANIEASKLEEAMLITNNETRGSQTGVSILELKQIALYFSQTMTQIKQKQRQFNTKIEHLQNELNATNSELYHKDSTEKWYSKVDVEVNAPAQTNATLLLEYFVSGASWSPIYDLRVNDLTGKMYLVYKAQIYQNTGLDWNNVALTISTGNPMLNNEKPSIRKRFVDAYQITNDSYKFKSKSTEMGSVRGARTENTAFYIDGVKIQNTTNIDFAIEKPYSIASNNKPYLVEINKYTFDALYEIYAAPEWDKSAYLTAQTSGWENNGFETGDMNIFLAGTFIGTTYFNPNTTSDTLTLSLGRDKSTIIDRVQTTDFSKNKTLSNVVEETFEYTIKVKNTRDYPIKTKIEEQIPLSKNDDVKVNIISIGDAKQDSESGILTWALTLKAKETITLKYSYSVKRPKDRKIDVVY